jgi:hypothetical protein
MSYSRLRTFYDSEVAASVKLCRHFYFISRPLSWFDGLRGSGHPDPDFRIVSFQHNEQPCSRSTKRRKAPCHGFHESNR